MRRGGLKKPEGRSKLRRGALFKCHAISMKFVQEDAAKRAKETRDLAQEVVFGLKRIEEGPVRPSSA